MSQTPNALRESLWPFSMVYSAVMGLRNHAFDSGWKRSYGLDVPVVSVGNLTVGGTGKTPTVVWLVEQARRLGWKPGVLARGYGRARGALLNDEGMLLEGRFPGLPQVQDPDRVAGGRRLVAEFDVDLVLLDDGFQHRRLKRDHDILCMDGQQPFARGRVLPAGDLRESLRGLRRADAVILTRAAGLQVDALGKRRAHIRKWARNPALPIFTSEHAPRDVLDAEGEVQPLSTLKAQPMVLMSALASGSRQAFGRLASELGVEVLGHREFSDHRSYSEADLVSVLAMAEAEGATVLTTEKDAVKLRAFDLPFQVLRIDLRFFGSEPNPGEVGLVKP